MPRQADTGFSRRNAPRISRSRICLQGLENPACILDMSPRHREGLVGPTQDFRIIDLLHAILELVHVVLVIAQNLLHIRAIKRVA